VSGREEENSESVDADRGMAAQLIHSADHPGGRRLQRQYQPCSHVAAFTDTVLALS
jgi:hypothetical protein